MSQNTLLIIPSPHGDLHVFIDITVLLTFLIVKQHWAELIRDGILSYILFSLLWSFVFFDCLNGNKWKTHEIPRKKHFMNDKDVINSTSFWPGTTTFEGCHRLRNAQIKVKAIRLFSLNLSIFLHNIHFIVLSNNLFILFLSEITPWWYNGKRASLECGRPWVWFWFIVLNATIFQLVVAVSFIGEETPKDPGKHPICRKSLTSCLT